jgi:hypothetical protein
MLATAAICQSYLSDISRTKGRFFSSSPLSNIKMSFVNPALTNPLA